MDSMGNTIILAIDDDLDSLRATELLLRRHGKVWTASSPERGLEMLSSGLVDLAIVDLNFEGQHNDGIFLLSKLARVYPNVPVIVHSGDTNTRRIVDASRYHLVEFVVKGDSDCERLVKAVEKAIAMREMSVRSHANLFETKSPAMREVLTTIGRVLKYPGKSHILILGETGTGKEVMAKHIASGLGKPLTVANMAAIRPELAESILFGHRKGSFSGAACDKIGLIEAAKKGLFLLDELGELPLDIQAKLLRTIQDGEVLRVGENAPRHVDVRFIASTNRDLEEMVAAGTFREDLLHRLNTVTIRLLPLRERREDILFYANRFLKSFCPQEDFGFSHAACELLESYEWPGNVRELRNVVERLTIFADTRTISAEEVDRAIRNGAFSQTRSDKNTTLPKTPERSDITREKLILTLEECGGNREHAAAKLGVHRATVFRWIKEQGIAHIIAAKCGRPSLLVNKESKTGLVGASA